MAKLNFNASNHTVEGVWHTFNEWRELGFGVKVGETASRFKNGEGLFSRSQVLDIELTFKDEIRKHLKREGYAVGMGGPMWWKD